MKQTKPKNLEERMLMNNGFVNLSIRYLPKKVNLLINNSGVFVSMDTGITIVTVYPNINKCTQTTHIKTVNGVITLYSLAKSDYELSREVGKYIRLYQVERLGIDLSSILSQAIEYFTANPGKLNADYYEKDENGAQCLAGYLWENISEVIEEPFQGIPLTFDELTNYIARYKAELVRGLFNMRSTLLFHENTKTLRSFIDLTSRYSPEQQLETLRNYGHA